MIPLRISVIIPVYNRRAYLREAVKSILSEQELEDLEVIVVDDGSTDGSLDTIEELPVIRIREDKNRGQSHAQNVGLDYATGDFISFFDSDDRLVPGGLEWRARWLLEHPSAPGVTGEIRSVIDAEGKELGNFYHYFNLRQTKPKKKLKLEFFEEGGEIYAPLVCTLLKREVIHRIGFFDPQLYCGQDRDYFLRALQITPIPFVSQPVLDYRIHGDNQSGFPNHFPNPGQQRLIRYGKAVNLFHGVRIKKG